MLESLVSWSGRVVWEEWDTGVGKWRQRAKGRRRKREKGSASLPLWFPMKLILIPLEISHCPLSPLRPASITYLSRGWMIYTLPMSTADWYTHQWLPVLRDHTDKLKRQRKRETGKTWQRMDSRKRNNQSWRWRSAKRKSKRVKGNPPEWQGWKRVEVWLGQMADGIVWVKAVAGEADNRGNELMY